MVNQVITNIQEDLRGILDDTQMNQLTEVLTKYLLPLEKSNDENFYNNNMLPLFVAAKRVEECSVKSLRYYETMRSSSGQKILKYLMAIPRNIILK